MTDIARSEASLAATQDVSVAAPGFTRGNRAPVARTGDGTNVSSARALRRGWG